jgi:chromosome segregation ATPase
MNEIKILQQHNNELIALTSKYGQVELENVDLKKKLFEHAQEQQTLKTVFNNEQANIVALKSTNEQLLAKLQDLQANINTLTVQLAVS